MAGAVAGDAARKNFASFSDEFLQLVRVFVIDEVHFVGTETACLAASGGTFLIHTHDGCSLYLEWDLILGREDCVEVLVLSFSGRLETGFVGAHMSQTRFGVVGL